MSLSKYLKNKYGSTENDSQHSIMDDVKKYLVSIGNEGNNIRVDKKDGFVTLLYNSKSDVGTLGMEIATDNNSKYTTIFMSKKLYINGVDKFKILEYANITNLMNDYVSIIYSEPTNQIIVRYIHSHELDVDGIIKFANVFHNMAVNLYKKINAL